MVMFRFALGTAPFPRSLQHGLECVEAFVAEAAAQAAQVICFPESYLPGMRGIDEPVGPHAPNELLEALERAQWLARHHGITVILPMDRDHGGAIQNVAHVLSPTGQSLGYQAKCQLDPTEDAIFVPGSGRRVFEAAGVTFGISICHEGFRYPESVRWAAERGAVIVFHPHCTGSNHTGRRLTTWRGPENRYFEHAMTLRALENQIYFASVNYAFEFQESASAVISPTGECIAHQPYGKAGVLVVEVDTELATRQLALRYRPSLYEPSAP